MADMEGIKARIRALRSKTIENGCTEAEALAAAEKVMALLQQHRLEDWQDAVAEEEVQLGSSRRSALSPLFGVVAWVCHCQAMYVARPGRLSLIYLGRDPWPEAAGYLHAVVQGAAKRATADFRLTDTYRRRRKPATRARAQKHFLEGFVSGLTRKLFDLKRAAGDGSQQARDLVLAEKALRLHDTWTLRPLRGAKPDSRFQEARLQGLRAGQETHVGWGVGSAGRGGLLERSEAS